MVAVSYNLQNPQHGHSCNAVGGSQISSIGVEDSNSKITFGDWFEMFKSTFDTAPDPFAQGLAVFDMTKLSFVDQFNAAAPPYEQSDAVKQLYAQSQG